MKYYCVTTKIDEKGNGWSGITNIVETDKKPEDRYTTTKKGSFYINWFNNRKEAEYFVYDCNRA